MLIVEWRWNFRVINGGVDLVGIRVCDQVIMIHTVPLCPCGLMAMISDLQSEDASSILARGINPTTCLRHQYLHIT